MPVPSFAPGNFADVFAQDVGYPSGSGVDFYYATVATDISVDASNAFIGTGGTGQAFLDGNLLIVGGGQSQYNGPGCTYSTSFESFAGGCTNSGDFDVPFSIPFTFGQSFTLFADVTLADGCPPCWTGFGYSDAGLTWEYTGVYDANGNLIPGAAFSQIQTPEGSTPSLVILGLFFILASGLSLSNY